MTTYFFQKQCDELSWLYGNREFFEYLALETNKSISCSHRLQDKCNTHIAAQCNTIWDIFTFYISMTLEFIERYTRFPLSILVRNSHRNIFNMHWLLEIRIDENFHSSYGMWVVSCLTSEMPLLWWRIHPRTAIRNSKSNTYHKNSTYYSPSSWCFRLVTLVSTPQDFKILVFHQPMCWL